jgi:gliding motility-associated-like protein
MDSMNVNVASYPQVIAGVDTGVCYGNTVHLFASTTAPFFAWSPTNSLSQANTLTPIATPTTTTSYIITVRDVQGCPKPVSDTTVVTVFPHVNANAGNDTVIVANQPLQLNATGGTSYIWSPTTGLSNPSIANPVVTLSSMYDSITYHVTVTSGNICSASDDIKVFVFKTQPDIFVPSAFTPNNDGLNDRLKAIPVGIKEFKYFKVFNRWGELVFATTNANNSWDGIIKGQPQSTGVFTWMAKGIDFRGTTIERKGTITLIR